MLVNIANLLKIVYYESEVIHQSRFSEPAPGTTPTGMCVVVSIGSNLSGGVPGTVSVVEVVSEGILGGSLSLLSSEELVAGSEGIVSLVSGEGIDIPSVVGPGLGGGSLLGGVVVGGGQYVRDWPRSFGRLYTGGGGRRPIATLSRSPQLPVSSRDADEIKSRARAPTERETSTLALARCTRPVRSLGFRGTASRCVRASVRTDRREMCPRPAATRARDSRGIASGGIKFWFGCRCRPVV